MSSSGSNKGSPALQRAGRAINGNGSGNGSGHHSNGDSLSQSLDMGVTDDDSDAPTTSSSAIAPDGQKWLRRYVLPAWRSLIGSFSQRWVAGLVLLSAVVGLLTFLQTYRFVPRDSTYSSQLGAGGNGAAAEAGITNSVQPHPLSSRITDTFAAVSTWAGTDSDDFDEEDGGSAGPSDDIHIALCGDKDYYVGLLALINSTLSNCRTAHTLRFHLVTVDEESKAFLERVVLQHFPAIRVDGEVLNVDTGHALPTAAVWAKYRSSALSKPIVYARYLFPDVFPQLHRVIYLDQDVLVTGDIRQLWEVDLEGAPIAAARLSRPGAEFFKQFKMKDPSLQAFSKRESSLNNGVLIYDLDAWRKPGTNYTDQLLAWTALNKQRQLYQLGSQPPFNLVFYNNYRVLDTKWNVMDLAGLSRVGTKEPVTVPHSEIVEGGILHWNGVLKPWGCTGHYSELWRHYLPNFRQYLPANDTSHLDCGSAQVWTENMRMRSGVEKFTVVLTSFMRVDNLLRIVQHLRKSDYIREVVLVWNNQNASCPAEVAQLVRCFPQPDNFVHNRFRPWSHITTDAVLQHDDDILVPLLDLENAFKLWTLHRERMLGFEPRVIRCADEEDAATCGYKFKLLDGYFDLVIGKLFFVRNSYMRDFLADDRLINLTSHAPCEDLAMNFFVGRQTNLPPLLYTANITEIKSEYFAGLSQGINTAEWRELRHSCINLLYEHFGGKAVQPQPQFFHLDSVQEFVLHSNISKAWSWCSDTHGSRLCRQP